MRLELYFYIHWAWFTCIAGKACYLGWDVALTADGPLVLECNTFCSTGIFGAALTQLNNCELGDLLLKHISKHKAWHSVRMDGTRIGQWILHASTSLPFFAILWNKYALYQADFSSKSDLRSWSTSLALTYHRTILHFLPLEIHPQGNCIGNVYESSIHIPVINITHSSF